MGLRDIASKLFGGKNGGTNNANSDNKIPENSNPTMETIEKDQGNRLEKLAKENKIRFADTIDDLNNLVAETVASANKTKTKTLSEKLSPDWLSEKYYKNGTPQISCILKHLGVSSRLADNEVIQNSIPERFHNGKGGLNIRR